MIDKIKSNIKSGGQITSEYRDYLLCKEFSKLPSDLDNESEYDLNLFFIIYNLEKKEEYLNSKRKQQKQSL